MPEATAEAWRNGWFHTGDQFTHDEDGDFYFLDRIKDVIRRRGENISSFEVEAEVLSHPLVKEVAAVAVPNPDVDESAGDEEVKVVVVLARRAPSLDPWSSSSTSSARMPRYWVPRFVEFLAGAAADRVPQAQEGRAARGRDHAADVGPREGRDHAHSGKS